MPAESTHRALARHLAPAALLALGACASRPTADGTPPDFSLSIVRAAPRAATPDSPPHVLPNDPGWYVLEPGGLLRAAVGVRTRDTRLPPPVRTLSPAQVDEVFALARAAGLADHAPLAGVTSTDDATPPPGGMLVHAAIHARRRTRLIEQPSPEADALWSRLRELAWASPAPSRR